MIIKDLYKNKYLKYKNKYLNLQSQIGGTVNVNLKITRVRPIYSTDGFQVKINWTHSKSQSDIQNLNVFDYQIISKPSEQITTFIYQNGINKFVAFVGGLQYNKFYNFMVIVHKHNQRSIPSDDKIRILSNVPITPIIEDVKIINNDAEITWNFNEEYGCGLSVVTYKIFVDNKLIDDKFQGNTKRAIIKNINQKVENAKKYYSISIIANNLNGDSPESKLVYKRNITTGPTNIRDLNVKYGNNCALVTWKMGDFGNGDIIKYIITFTPFSFNFNSDEINVIKVIVNKVELENTGFVVEGLQNDKKYNCKVKVFNQKSSVENSINQISNFFSNNYPTNNGLSKTELEKLLKSLIATEKSALLIQKEEEKIKYDKDIANDKLIIESEQTQKDDFHMIINKDTIKNCSKKIDAAFINEKIKLLKKICNDKNLIFDKLKLKYVYENEKHILEVLEQKNNWDFDLEINKNLLNKKKINLLLNICNDNKLDFNTLKKIYLNVKELKLVEKLKLTSTYRMDEQEGEDVDERGGEEEYVDERGGEVEDYDD